MLWDNCYIRKDKDVTQIQLDIAPMPWLEAPKPKKNANFAVYHSLDSEEIQS